MALRFFDGFDGYTDIATLLTKWTSENPSNVGVTTSASGRNGGRCLNLQQWHRGVIKLIDSQATWIVGFALSFTNSVPIDGTVIVTFKDGATTHIDLRLTSGRLLRVTRNGTTLATGTVQLAVNTFNYIEIKGTINDSTGAVTVKVNGVTDINISGVDTRNGGNSTADTIQFGSVTAVTETVLIDDVYMCDGTGSAPSNDFLGDVKAVMCVPTGAGNYTQWTPSTGSNWQNVDETNHNSDTDYNSDSTPGHRDSFAMSDLPAGAASVFGVNYLLVPRKDDAGTRQVAPFARIAGTDYDGTTVSVGSGYVPGWEQHELSPATGSAWTPSEVNGMEFGYKEVA